MYVIHHNTDLQIEIKILKELILYSHKYIIDSELAIWRRYNCNKCRCFLEYF